MVQDESQVRQVTINVNVGYAKSVLGILKVIQFVSFLYAGVTRHAKLFAMIKQEIQRKVARQSKRGRRYKNSHATVQISPSMSYIGFYMRLPLISL